MESCRALTRITTIGKASSRWRKRWKSAIAERRHLIVEAGTGTGKTLAYLVPSILSGKRVVISTGTKNLQEQLYFKDLPFLQSLFRPASFGLLYERAFELRVPAEGVRRDATRCFPGWMRLVISVLSKVGNASQNGR